MLLVVAHPNKNTAEIRIKRVGLLIYPHLPIDDQQTRYPNLLTNSVGLRFAVLARRSRRFPSKSSGVNRIIYLSPTSYVSDVISTFLTLTFPVGYSTRSAKGIALK